MSGASPLVVMEMVKVPWQVHLLQVCFPSIGALVALAGMQGDGGVIKQEGNKNNNRFLNYN